MNENYIPLEKFVRKFGLTLTEKHEANINVSVKDDMYLYNYSQYVVVPRDDEIIMLCRGLVLNENGDVMNFPFKRFFNMHEKECKGVDISNSDILEKLDGTLISVWFDGKEWRVTTRGCFPPASQGVDYSRLFREVFNGFDKLTTGHTYMFELIHKEDPHITRYDENFAVLIGARNLYNLEEENQYKLDIIAQHIGVRRPRAYNAANVEECKKLFEEMREDEEGLVIVDYKFNRMKLKQESYLKMDRIKNLKEQDILDYVLGRTDIDGDFSGMKDVQYNINYIKSSYNEVKEKIYEIYEKIKHIETQKEFASHAKEYPFSGILFKLRSGIEMDSLDIKWDRINQYYEYLGETRPMCNKLIVLRGVPGSGKSTWIKEMGFEPYVLSMDAIRIMLKTPIPTISQEYNDEVWKLFSIMLEIRMSNGSFTILDNTHIEDKSLEKYIGLCKKYGYKLVEKKFNTSLEEAIERNKNREEFKRVPENVIANMYNKLNKSGGKE